MTTDYIIVPKEPDQAMSNAGAATFMAAHPPRALVTNVSWGDIRNIYRAMIAAGSPKDLTAVLSAAQNWNEKRKAWLHSSNRYVDEERTSAEYETAKDALTETLDRVF